ncbi:Patatin [Forsythia ovata]|uniref:Patatin n=1 Tax=Forsythia ovata TaxID=205694 RepID=A0ABD1TT62_9LAMI
MYFNVSANQQQQHQQDFLPHRNQRWVHLPVTICEAFELHLSILLSIPKFVRVMDLDKVTLEIFSKLEQKWLYHCKRKKTWVLSIDGGGTTGIVANAALVHLESQIQTKTSDSHAHLVDFFDIIAGTGIGGFLAAILDRPLFSAKDAERGT